MKRARKTIATLNLLAAALLLSLAACAPKPEEMQFQAGKRDFGPQREDVDLQLGNGIKTVDLQWSEDVTASVFFRMNENFMSLNRRDNWKSGSLQGWIRQWWAARPVQTQNFADGAYAKLLMKTSADSAEPMVKDAANQLEQNRFYIVNQLKAAKVAFPKSKKASLEEIADAAFDFVKNFENDIPKMKLHPALEGVLREEVGKQRRAMRDQVDDLIREVRRKHSLSFTLETVQAFAKEQGIKLDRATLAQIDQGVALGETIDNFQGPQEALSLLIDIWGYLEPEKRQQVFSAASETLYNFLKKQDDEGMKCLANSSCGEIFKNLVKNLGIFPQLEKYGLEKLRKDIDGQAADYAMDVLRDAVRDALKDEGPMLADLIDSKMKDRVGEIEALAKDFNGDVHRRLSNWSNTIIPKSPLRIEKTLPSRVRPRVNDGRLHVQFLAPETPSLETEGSSLGLGARLATEGWLDESANRSWFLSQFDQVASDYQEPRNLAARSHAEILRGLSLMARPLREFEHSVFDDLFGFANAQQLFPSFQVAELNMSLFPKDALFALSLSKLGQHLEIVTTQSTPVFLVDTDNNLTWADQYNFNGATTENSQAIMAGIVDRAANERAGQVRSEDVARYMLGLCEFLKTSANIENSRSVYLHEKRDGKIPMDTLKKELPKLKLLVLGLANYLSHQMRRADGLIHQALKLPAQEPVSKDVFLLDQALAVRALVEASEVLSIDIYRWEAMDILAAMNKELFRTELGFYTNEAGTKRPTLPVLVETLRSLNTIEPYLPAARRTQIQQIEDAWLSKVGQLF